MVKKDIFFNLKVGLIILTIVVVFVRCSTNSDPLEASFSQDPEIIKQGNIIFDNNCVACHNFKTSGIGPSLAGITQKVSPDWLKKFIINPTEMIDSGDKRSVGLFERYGQYMPGFSMLEDTEIAALMAYLHTKEPRKARPARVGWGDPIDNPIEAKIPLSDLTLILEEYAQLPFTAKSGQKARINKIAPIGNGSLRLFTHDLRGKLYELVNQKPLLFLDLAKLKPHFMHTPGHGTGMGSFAFHPEYSENGLFYTTHTEKPETSAPADFSYDEEFPNKVRWVLTEWRQNDPNANVFSGSHRELMRIDMVTQIHGVQAINFNPMAKPGDEDYGLLFIGIGDGGSVGQQLAFLAEGNTYLYSSILRIDPLGNNSTNGRYGIPPTNPYADDGDDQSLGEIYANGFRNPHRFTWDPNDGKMLASCIGQHYVEELNLVIKGANYGWPEREGTFRSDKESDLSKIYPLPTDDNQMVYTDPVAQFDHDEALAICGGYVYNGAAIPGLKGKYIFGGIVAGRVFMVDATDLKLGTQAPIQEISLQLPDGTSALWPELTENIETGHSRVDFRLGMDEQGELYMSTKANGKIFKVIGEVKKNVAL